MSPETWLPWRAALSLLFLTAVLGGGCSNAPASERLPYTPASDETVLEQVPATALDERARERAALRRQLTTRPEQLEQALRLARLDIEEGRARGDPRYLGRAQAALAPWWDAPQPPHEVLLLRATIRQGRHEFEAALADLELAVREQPEDAQAWLTRAVVLGVRGEHAEAARSCAPLTRLAGALVSAVCQAQVHSLAGRSRQAHTLLSEALASASREGASLEQQAWAISTLAEAAARAGDAPRAEHLFSRAMALDPRDAYTRAAWADLLIDLGRPREAAELVREHGADDAMLLRRVLAEKALDSPQAPALVAELASRYAASRLRGDAVHAREEARFALHIEKDFPRALALAEANWRVQREPWDTRLLLEAALAAGKPAAAQPALSFLEASGCEDPGLAALAQKIRKAAP
ncbi:tetratricopeptide repeat protein [Hyalangium rubrum]|uniref:Tetratricopeptide repeat protein n=1 Tax=Hyalangium rubrum TaxID=3103134 RepID=A0ABU5H5N6_9BACT|nr:hypothetical protein [Hyalangium sp. s54d21]MDY7228179.1 hypothetical protein [Hyalangium sp. s54d21]